MSRRKRQPEEFDVIDFLRESDDDLKSALNSLLGSPADSVPATNLGPDIKISPEVNSVPEIILDPHPILDAGVDLSAGPKGIEAEVVPAPTLTPGPDLPKKRWFPIREMKIPQDAHTRAEQHVYERLWENGSPLGDGSRTVTMGFGAMARLVGLSESNARINLRSLIAKLAIQEMAEYNCAQSLGRTYRILPYAEIMQRRREAGLLWYMRRTLAVVFVNPATGEPVHPKRPPQRKF